MAGVSNNYKIVPRKKKRLEKCDNKKVSKATLMLHLLYLTHENHKINTISKIRATKTKS